MKKMNSALGSFVILGLLLASCGTDDEETKQVDAPVQQVEPAQDNESKGEVMERPPMVNEFNEETDDLEEAFFSEYSSVKSFVESSVNHMKEGSDYREKFAHAEQFLAESTITYIGYFHEEIEELGMTEDFEELKTAAAELIEKFGTGGEHLEGYETKYMEFENKMKDVYSKM
ncbi:hypothetical protein CSV69_16020 [Sporosarcina sp. P26b]|uniref:hypothetical protein n=1 Tax=Sporosarcina sp. P26b TaxID=2048253 RepID=UPI000C165C38|nr:hypothetical protein [Sporosarcina sp. P26b]PIC94577.1 hypothetical protein CSV69_16020 [Sporosarcina sp. P26b]